MTFRGQVLRPYMSYFTRFSRERQWNEDQLKNFYSLWNKVVPSTLTEDKKYKYISSVSIGNGKTEKTSYIFTFFPDGNFELEYLRGSSNEDTIGHYSYGIYFLNGNKIDLEILHLTSRNLLTLLKSLLVLQN